MKKVFLFPVIAMAILLLSSCSSSSSKKDKTNLTDAKYTTLIKDLKAELASISDVSWDFKKSKNVTNADISKGVMIEVFPKSEKITRH